MKASAGEYKEPMISRWSYYNATNGRQMVQCSRCKASKSKYTCMHENNCHTWIMHSFGKNGLEGSPRMADTITGNGPIRIKIEDDKSNWKKTDEADKADRTVV